MAISEQYQALRETAGIGTVAPRAAIGVRGPDRASFLQGLLTNDIQALTPGTGCYAAWLTAQGIELVDCQVRTEHLARFGAREVPRATFLADLAAALTRPTRRGPWSLAP